VRTILETGTGIENSPKCPQKHDKTRTESQINRKF
jgi:hypothetical protein